MTKHVQDTSFRAVRTPLFGLAMLGLIGLVPVASGPGAQDAKPNHYIGSAKCKNCHSFDEGGAQYPTWQEAKHSSAYEALATDEAKKVAKDRGITDPQKSEQCLKCHVTAYGEPKEMFKKGFKISNGVQCETCHGPGEKHMRARFRAAALEEDLPEGQVPEFVTIPDDELIKAPKRELCYSCHNKKSPSFKAFCYYERIAKIRHLDPRKPRTKEEKAALLVCGCGEGCGCTDECPEGSCGVPPKGKD